MSHSLPPAPMDFRFLDPPADIRLMVYELLPTCRTHNKITIETDDGSGLPKMKITRVKLINIWYPTAVRLISKIIREEATPIIARTTAKRNSTLVADDSSKVSRSGPKLILLCGDLEVIAHQGGPLETVLGFLNWFLDARKTGSSCVTSRPKRSVSDPNSSAITKWARQAGWHLSQMRPGARAIDIAIDAEHVLSMGRRKTVTSLLRFEDAAEGHYLAQRRDIRFRMCTAPLVFAAHSVSRYVPLRGPATGGRLGYFVEHFDLEWEKWVEAWVPQDCV